MSKKPIPGLPVHELNFHHLLYFWVAAREGSVTKAGELLHLAQQTISGQIHTLESQLGTKLFVRKGRGLALTDAGGVVYRYASEIFTLGQDLVDDLKSHPSGRPAKLVVGVVDVLPKLTAYQLLKPALDQVGPVRVVCYEGKLDRLLADLAVHDLDLVLSDAPIGNAMRVRAYCHRLAECDVAIYGVPALARQAGGDFPKSLGEVPWLLPTANTALRAQLDEWLATKGFSPLIVGEFEDMALLLAFARAGAGVFAAPTLMEGELVEHFGVARIGKVPALREDYYAISLQRRVAHPVVKAIIEQARLAGG